jgi:hypothetical protein
MTGAADTMVLRVQQLFQSLPTASSARVVEFNLERSEFLKE